MGDRLARIKRRINGGAGKGGTNHRCSFVGVNADEFVVAVGTDIANPESGVGGEFTLDSKGPGDERGSFHVRLNTTRHEFRAGGHRSERVDGKTRNRKCQAVDGIERVVLIGTVTERVLQIVVHAESGTEDGLGSMWTPSKGDSGLWEILGVVYGEKGIPKVWLGVDDAVCESVVGGAAVGFVPTG